MANIKSAKKRILVTETKTARNKAIRSKVKTAVKSLIKKNSYAWLKTKYYEISKKRKNDDDIEFLVEAFTDYMAELKDMQKELKKLYT